MTDLHLDVSDVARWWISNSLLQVLLEHHFATKQEGSIAMSQENNMLCVLPFETNLTLVFPF